MFGQTVKIWQKEIPRSDVILIIIDAINYSRYEGDMIKEELLFHLLIDIMRNPEVLREITDSVLESRNELFVKRLQSGR